MASVARPYRVGELDHETGSIIKRIYKMMRINRRATIGDITGVLVRNHSKLYYAVESMTLAIPWIRPTPLLRVSSELIRGQKAYQLVEVGRPAHLPVYSGNQPALAAYYLGEGKVDEAIESYLRKHGDWTPIACVVGATGYSWTNVFYALKANPKVSVSQYDSNQVRYDYRLN